MKIHKKLITLGLVMILLLGVSMGVVIAQTAPGAPPAGGTFEQRLVQRKRERNIRLEEKDQRRLSSRCVPAQGVIRTLQQRTAPVVINRAKIYRQIDGKIWIAIGRLKLSEKDSFNLEKQRATLAGKAAAYQTLAANYQQALEDIVVVNCEADVTGFKALVDTARIYHEQLRDRSADIRDYVVNTIQPSLAGFVTELETKPAVEIKEE